MNSVNQDLTSKQFNWYLVQIKLFGLSYEEAMAGLSDLQEELELRTHLRNPHAKWDEIAHCIVAQIEIYELSPGAAGLVVYDDFFEAVVATINFEESIKVEVSDVYKI